MSSLTRNAEAGPSSPSSNPALVPSSSSPAIMDPTPLAPARLIASSSRRGVNFSPKLDTRIFDSTESILPEKSVPPPSIRSYADSLPSSPSSNASPLFRSTPPFALDTPRSILKQRLSNIRVARSVEEGTLNNREAARLLVTGRRPGLVARDSFQLAIIRKGADELALKTGSRRRVDEMPGSDESIPSPRGKGKEEGSQEDTLNGSSDEEEEEMEQDGALGTGSLVHIILHGAEDLLTIEEAYKTLTLRLKHRIPLDEDEVMDSPVEDIEVVMRPLRDEAPAMIRALQRDIQRLLGKVPTSEIDSPDRSSSPFRGLMPLHDSTPINQMPSPPTSAGDSNKSPSKPSRQGYSESEVRYRREAAGVGQAAMGFLALALHTRHIFSCFTEADIQSLLDMILVIPRTPHLPTPNPKKTYFAAISIISNAKVPAACVTPLKDKLAKAVEVMTGENYGTSSRDPNLKKEVYNAIVNLISTHPSTFFPFTNELLAPCLKALSSPVVVVRNRAAVAVVAFAAAKFNIQQLARDRAMREKTTAAKAEWTRVRTVVNKSEIFVTNFLKRTRANPGKPGSTYGPDGEKRTEWTCIERLIKEKMGTDVYWTCAVWASLVSLVGSQYSTSGLAPSMDHIMDRSLQISVNTTRPLLARIAWSHAIHAYFSAGHQQSIGDSYQLRQSFKPFASYANQDATTRIKTIQMPVEIGLAAVNAETNTVTRSRGPNSRFADSPRCFWERSEKSKRVTVMATCAEGAAAVIYAYVGAAFLHEDQLAKEMTAMTGLLSSDGIPVPESAFLEAKMERLDKAWDMVVQPLIAPTLSLFGIDRLKLHGWSLLESLTRHNSDTINKWDLDRLLCDRYLSGEALMDKLKDKEVASSFLNEVEKEVITPKDVPSMGSAWVARRLGDVLDLFQMAIGGINGLNDLYGGEAVNLTQDVVFPVVLSRIWASILHSLANSRSQDPALYASGVRLITRHLCQVFNGEPSSYLPISLMGEQERWVVNLDSGRILIFTRLFDMAHAILGPEAVSAPILSAQGDEVDAAMSKMAFGTDLKGHYSMAGSLLALLMGTKVFSAGLATPARATLKHLVGRILDAGCVQGMQNRILGDMTNRLHAVYEDQENIQLDMWRTLATKWSSIVDNAKPSSGSATNHTGALLVSLLSSPFRGRQLHSVWHHEAGEEDLAIWNNLLQVVVARFRAKRVGSNLGVLETLAGHLGDFLREAEKASSSTITLSCLASATSYLSCTELSHHVEDHYSINENYVPSDFLTLVSDALDEAYPRTDTLEAIPREDAVSPAVYTLLTILCDKFESLPTEFAHQAFEAVRPGLMVWLTDDNKVVMPDAAVQVDKLYVAVLRLLGSAVDQGILACEASVLDSMLDVVAPRLSRAVSRVVPEAFQSLWTRFEDLNVDSFAEDTVAFLQSVVAAVPNLIIVKGLSVESDMSSEESFAKYPHAREVESQSQRPEEVALVPSTPDVEMTPAVDISTEYDADMSASVEATLVVPTPGVDVRPEPVHTAANSSPVLSETTDQSMVEESRSSEEQGSDVFGPSSVPVATKTSKRKGRKAARPVKGKKSKSSRSRSSTAETDAKPVIPDSEGDDEIADCIVIAPDTSSYAPAPRGERSGLFSASRWISALPGIGTLFSPNRTTFAPITETPIPVTQTQTQSQSPETSGSTGRKRKTPTQLTRSISEPQVVTGTVTRSGRTRSQITTPAMGRQTKRQRISQTRSEPVIVIESDDEEDPLLLSPESARQRHAEERAEREERERIERETLDSKDGILATIDTQSSTGRYDDAPESLQPKAGGSKLPVDSTTATNNGKSPARTAQHMKVLEMVRTAEAHSAVIASMNHTDLGEFSEIIDFLKANVDQVWRRRMSEMRRGHQKGKK